MQRRHLRRQKLRIRLQLLHVIRCAARATPAATCCCCIAFQHLLLCLFNSCVRLLCEAYCTPCCQLLSGLQ